MSNGEFAFGIFILIIALIIAVGGGVLLILSKLGVVDLSIKNFIYRKLNKNKEAVNTTSSYNYKEITTPTVPLNDDIEPIELFELKYEYNDVNLATIDKSINFSAIKPNEPCRLETEPDNEYDNKAIAVYFEGVKIGYIKKGRFQDMYHDFVARKEAIDATISKVVEQEIYINLKFYKYVDPIKYLENNCETKRFKLTGNTSDDYQEEISFISEGDEVNYTWDYDKSKYGSDIGFFPKSAEEYLERNAPVYVYNTDTDEEGRYFVEVIVKIK